MNGIARLKRRIDRRFYRALYRVYRSVLPTQVGRAPVPPQALGRVLVIPRHAVGDLTAVTPVLSYLRAVAPHAAVDVLASRRNATLLVGDARVHRIVDGDPRWYGWPRLVRDLRRRRYSMVVSAGHRQHLLQGVFAALVAGREAARVTWFRPIRYWGLFTHVGRAPGFERRHVAERLLYAVQRAVAPGVARPAALADYPMSLVPDPDAAARVREALGAPADGPFVAVNCWATMPNRRFGVGQTAQVLTSLARRYPAVRFVLTPPPRAADSAAAIVRAVYAEAPDLEPARVTVYPPTPRLTDLAALLRAASVVLTPDTANVHLASAVGTPVVAVFATTNNDPYRMWGPIGVPFRTIAHEPPRFVGETPPAEIVRAFASLWEEIAEVRVGRVGGALTAPP